MKRIIVNHLSKEFKIGTRQDHTSLSRFLSFFSGKEQKKAILALDNVSFSADAGEIIGVIGKNGSGKTTLLRILADIYTIYRGTKIITGRIIPVIGLGHALKLRLTMAENIFLVCSLLGLSQTQIKKRFDSIVEFSGLQNFIDTKLYQFSGGMGDRMAFSIVIHCNPEILLLDEVLAVGDESFRVKSASEIKRLAKAGTTVIFVSHDLQMVEKYCDRAIWLDKGRIVRDGDVEEITRDYTNSMHNLKD